MHDRSDSIVVDLREDAGALLARIGLRLDGDHRQWVLDLAVVGEQTVPVDRIGTALSAAVRPYLESGPASIAAWPPADDAARGAILSAAGFSCTGRFLHRPAWAEDTGIAFLPLAGDELRVYLATHADRIAGCVADASGGDRAAICERVGADLRRRFASGSITDDEAIYALACAAQRAVGTIWISFHEIDGRNGAFIEEFCIDPAHRSRGYGSRTLRGIGGIGFGRRIDRMDLFVQTGNRTALQWYRKLGFCSGRAEYILFRRTPRE